MQQLEFSTKTNRVAESLRAEILRGALRAGAQLRQDEIAKRLGVSSTPVREAFGILEAEGFVERRPHRGVVVTAMDETMVDDSYLLRSLVEGFAARRAALPERREPVAVARMESALQQCSRALKAGNIRLFRTESRNFHRALVAAAGSDVLEQLHSVLMRKTIFNAQLDRAEMAKYQGAHERVFGAIMRGNGEEAAELLAMTCIAWRRKDHLKLPPPKKSSTGRAAKTGS